MSFFYNNTIDVNEGNITNAGEVHCDSLKTDHSATGLNIDFGGATGTNKITLQDNLANALHVNAAGEDDYMIFQTSDGNEMIKVYKGPVLENCNITHRKQTADTEGGNIKFNKSRNTTAGSHTVLQQNDKLGTIEWYGSDGSSFIQSALISASIHKAPGSNNMPGKLTFSTTSNAENSVTERMTISDDGFTLNGDVEFNGSGIIKTVEAGENLQGNSIEVNAGDSGTSDYGGGNLTLKAGAGRGSGNGGDIDFQTAPSGEPGSSLNSHVTKMIIKQNGKTGIGTDSPQHILDIANGNIGIRAENESTDSVIYIGSPFSSTNSAYKGAIYFDADSNWSTGTLHICNRLGLNDNATSAGVDDARISIKSDGTVGIGTRSPGTLLQLEDSAPYLTLKNSTLENTDGGCESKIIFEDHSDTTLAQIQASHDGTADDTKGDLIFSTHNGSELSEGMRIDSNGDIGMGTNSPNGKLHIFEETGTTLTASAGTIILEHNDTGGQSSILFKSKENSGNDYGFIKYSDDGAANGTSSENSLLEIGVQNDGNDGNADELKFSVPGGYMYIRADGNVGIGETNPDGGLVIRSGGNEDKALVMKTSDESSTTGGYFDFRWAGSGTNYNMAVHMKDNDSPYSNHMIGYFENDSANSSHVFFTGQHRNILNQNITETEIGLIVSSTDTIINVDGSLLPFINEALPFCQITNMDNDKKVFGVISGREDTNDYRTTGTGSYKTISTKTYKNERRMYINSVGEGAIWVCNKNSTLENGDYITSTTVTGYGGKQTLNEGFLMNYTVAKITCDCDFSLTKIVKQKLKVTETTTDGVTTINIDYDANGNPQYEDDLDENGAQQMVYKYDTRFLQADGTQLVDEADYTTRLGNGESVYIACFVGCTYHCG